MAGDPSCWSHIFYENEKWNYTAVDSLKIPFDAIDQKVSRIRSNSYIKWEGNPSANSNFAAAFFYRRDQKHIGTFAIKFEILPHFVRENSWSKGPERFSILDFQVQAIFLEGGAFSQ